MEEDKKHDEAKTNRFIDSVKPKDFKELLFGIVAIACLAIAMVFRDSDLVKYTLFTCGIAASLIPTISDNLPGSKKKRQ